MQDSYIKGHSLGFICPPELTNIRQTSNSYTCANASPSESVYIVDLELKRLGKATPACKFSN